MLYRVALTMVAFAVVVPLTNGACGEDQPEPGFGVPTGPVAPEKLTTGAYEDGETRYLAFQIFTGSPNPEIPFDVAKKPMDPPPSKEAVGAMVDDIIKTIGTKGTKARRLGFVIGPLAFDHTDEQIGKMIRDAFDLAIEKNVAVGFHLDDCMCWSRRTDLMIPENIEWTDWDGTLSTGLGLDWGSPAPLAPRMCFNSEGIRTAVTHQAKDVIGPEIKRGIDRLKAEGKDDLFAGVILGWETHLGRDFDKREGPPKRQMGYHALTNRGFSKERPPENIDKEIASVVQQFVDLWAQGMVQAGIDQNRLYAHTCFPPEAAFERMKGKNPAAASVQYSCLMNFGPSSADPATSFGKLHRPGFSTYPGEGLFDTIHAQVAQHGNPHWASSEGTNILPGGRPGNTKMDMETYLARMFNHGAILVDIFSWGIGGEEARNSSPFWIVTEGPDAIAAYRKFLGQE